jgi:phospholipid:diacylglycerol acyltransferase
MPDNGDEVQLVPVSKLKGLTTRKRSRRRTGLVFGLGGLVGIFVALFFANKQEVINLDGLMDFNLDSFLDVIPAGMVKDAKDITVCSFSA